MCQCWGLVNKNTSDSFLQENGTIQGFPGAEKYDGDLLLEQCDILIPAAMESVLHEGNAEQVSDPLIICYGMYFLAL